jgi:hypothetical protein
LVSTQQQSIYGVQVFINKSCNVPLSLAGIIQRISILQEFLASKPRQRRGDDDDDDSESTNVEAQKSLILKTALYAPLTVRAE